MCRSALFALTVLAVIAVPVHAQSYQRRATMTGNVSDRGKCTIEVVVDGAAEVEIRGDTGVIRNLSGRQPEWRRFECNAPLPSNPAGFRFAGVDGRGRQELVRDPRSGGSAVVRIEDPQGGAEGYTFDLFWTSGPGSYTDQGNNRFDNRDRYRDRQFGADQAVRVCQD